MVYIYILAPSANQTLFCSFQTLRYSHRLQVWMNENYPITGGPHHEVHNFGSHGADVSVSIFVDVYRCRTLPKKWLVMVNYGTSVRITHDRYLASHTM